MQYVPSQSLVKDQLNQIRLLTNELQSRESDLSLLKDELSRLSDTCYDYQKQSETLESRYKFMFEENELKTNVLIEEISSLKQQKQALKTQNLELQQQSISFIREIKSLEEEIQCVFGEKEAITKEMEGFKQRIYHMELENEHLSAKIAQKNEILAKAGKEIQGIKAANTNLSNEIISLKDEIQRKALELSENHSMISLLNRTNEDLSHFKEDYSLLLQENEDLKSLISQNEHKFQQISSDFSLEREEFFQLRSSLEAQISEFSHELSKQKELFLTKEKEAQLLTEKINQDLQFRKTLDNDLKALILLFEAKKVKGLPSIELKSENLHLSVLKSKALEVMTDRQRARKQLKKLTGNQQLLLEDIKRIHEKLFQIGALAQNHENQGFDKLKSQYEEKLNEIDKAYLDKESRLEHILKVKDQEITQMAQLLNDHISMIKQKEQEKMDLLGVLGSPSPLPQPQPIFATERQPLTSQREELESSSPENHSGLIKECIGIISLLLQVISLGNEKYQTFLPMKKGYRVMLEYFLSINGWLNTGKKNGKLSPIRRFRKAVYCVVFCEILYKIFAERNLRNGTLIRFDTRHFHYNHLMNLIPKRLFLNTNIESRLVEILSSQMDISMSFNEVVAVIAGGKNSGKKMAPWALAIDPLIISKDVKRLKGILEGSHLGYESNVIRENGDKGNLLNEENDYIKSKLQELELRSEMLKIENDNVKQLLDDSENKRSILIQNFKELEKHAQMLAAENQILKEVE